MKFSAQWHIVVESYLYARPKVGYARNRSRKACFNEGFLKQAILGSKRLAEKPVDSAASRTRLVGRWLNHSPVLLGVTIAPMRSMRFS